MSVLRQSVASEQYDSISFAPLWFGLSKQLSEVPQGGIAMSGICACGCGQEAGLGARFSAGKRFISGHMTGKPQLWRPSLEEAFWSNVDKSAECWVWSGLHDKSGYGRLRHNYKDLKAHRVSWELHNGPISEGLLVCHHCDNPPCVRPDHLFLGTQSDNALDALSKGRLAQQAITHCPHGHPYSGSNLYFVQRQSGLERRCRECTRQQNRESYHRRASACSAREECIIVELEGE